MVTQGSEEVRQPSERGCRPGASSSGGAGQGRRAPAEPRSMSRPAGSTPPHTDTRGAGGPRRGSGPGAGHLRPGAHPAQRRRPGPGHRAVDRAPLPPRPRHPGRPPGARRGTGAHARGGPVVRRHDAPTGPRAGRGPRCRAARPHGPARASRPVRERRWRAAWRGRPVGVPRRPASPRCRSRRCGPGCGSSTTGWMPGVASRGCPSPFPWGSRSRCCSTGRRQGAGGRRHRGAPRRRPWLARSSWPGASQGGLAAVAYVEHLLAAPPGDGSPPCCRAAHWSGGSRRTRRPSARSSGGRRWSGPGRCARSRPVQQPTSRCSAATWPPAGSGPP